LLLRFGLDPGPAMSFRPGQHLELALGREPGTRVPYSIASAQLADRPGEFELAVSTVGGRDFVAELEVGTAVFVSRPRGLFVWEDHGGTTLLVGIGTGIAPLRAMLQASLAALPERPVTLLFGARSEADLLFGEELDELAARYPAFSFQPTLSQAAASWSGRRGRVQTHLADLAARLSNPAAYVCGTRTMVLDCVEILVSRLGIDPVRIKSEAH
jgi:CDP-4-dehydro-6-deoxyglucose reductase